MENKVKAWSWEKPTEPGLYLMCDGDVESEENISPFKLSEYLSGGREHCGFQCYSAEEVAEWSSSFKFGRLVVGG